MSKITYDSDHRLLDFNTLNLFPRTFIWPRRCIKLGSVDDDPAILNFVQEVLQPAGYRVLIAEGGWSAVEVYESAHRPIDLLLTDVIMPDLTGPVLAERLRSQQPDLRVLFISGFHDADLVQRFASRKGFILLPKPFSPDGLLKGVGQALQS
jgi:DNA-binding NtrC family response regulator